jgi:hypothetical protein
MKLETWLSLTAAIVSAIGTGLAAYAALEATRTSQRLATLQALDTFRVAIEKKDRGAACLRMLQNATPQAIRALVEHTEFKITAASTPEAARYCVKIDRDVAQNDELSVDKEHSIDVASQTFNLLNTYESLLLYWHDGVINRSVICEQLRDDFSLVVPFVRLLQGASNITEIKSLLDGFPTLQEFINTTRCTP